MTSKQINSFIKAHYKTLSDIEIARRLHTTPKAIEARRRNMLLKRVVFHGPATVEEAFAKREAIKTKFKDNALIEQLQKDNLRLTKERDAAVSLRKHVTTHIISPASKLKGEATLIALISDWHVEEPVLSAQVNGLNEYSLATARKRADSFFSTLLRLVQIEQENTRVDNLILALLGDFITNDIHEELAETAELLPAVAIRFAQELLVSGIDYLLANSKLKFTAICHSGNHARTTKDQRHGTEHGHSLEWLLYNNLADRYAHEPRIKFIIPDAYHSYVQVYDKTIRFHHGHAMNYGGGVGGITIPVRKAIAQWNTLKHADFDCFGHFHQSFDGNNFIANGSMIGYNTYALAIKAGFEEPTQMLFGIHSKLGKYITRPIKFL